jgi:hypothetical protein
MDNKDFINIIKEEIQNFDFLGNDEHLKEREVSDLLQNEDLQKQFICDSLLNQNGKVNIAKIEDSYITGNWDELSSEDANKVTMEYSLDLNYTYDSTQEPLVFNLSFDAKNINVSVDGWHDPGNYDNEPYGESWYDGFDWNDIEVGLRTMEGDEVKFTAFLNAPPKIQTLFIRQYTQNFVENETLKIKTPEMKDKVQDVPYC